jgi:ubiquinone/menaquinone biosynthesis C-methylase UbiE
MKRCLLAVGLMVSGVLAVAQDTSVSPGINRAYDGADYRRWQGMFETEGREVFENREAIIAALDIRPGMAIADVGAGTGAFSFPLAREVGITGKVIAQDISPEFLRGIEARARKDNLPQLHSLLGAEKEARLAPRSVDMVFTCDTYHHFEYPQAMLASLHQALRPGGRLIVIDYERRPGRSSPWVLGHVRAGRETVVAEIEAAGFKLLRAYQFLRENFFIEFVRP